MNPKVTNVLESLDRINRSSPAEATVTGTLTFPDWDGLNDHIQGIAPLNNTSAYTGVISGSSSDGAYIAAFENLQVTAVKIWPYQPEDYDHGGGVQALGSVLPVSVESDRDEDEADLGFYDVRHLNDPSLKYSFRMRGRKGSATAITNFTSDTEEKEKALLAVYEYDPRYIQFYLADYDKVAANINDWVDAGRYTGNALDGDQFQNFSLVTSTSNEIYLLGFRENEELQVYRVSMMTDPFLAFKDLIPVKKYTGWNDVADWRYGVGAQIVSSSQIRIFGTDKDPSGSENNYRFKIYIYS